MKQPSKRFTHPFGSNVEGQGSAEATLRLFKQKSPGTSHKPLARSVHKRLSLFLGNQLQAKSEANKPRTRKGIRQTGRWDAARSLKGMMAQTVGQLFVPKEIFNIA